MARLSERQRSILDFIWGRQQDQSAPPTVREIGEATALRSTGAVYYQLQQLEEGGYLTREAGVARGLSLTAKALELFSAARRAVEALVRVPLVGDIVASEPVIMGHDDFATYDPEDAVSISGDMLPTRTNELFALRVRGNSMIDAMVSDGDIVVMRPIHEVKNGDMVAVRLRREQETTLKYFHREGERVRLQPANPTMDPIYTAAANVQLQGKVVMVLRQLP